MSRALARVTKPPDVAVVLPYELPVASTSSDAHQIGPGLLIHQAYSYAGPVFESALGHFAHLIGHGPVAVTNRIKPLWPTWTGEEKKCAEIAEDCLKLIQYALPLETCDTQIETFKSIVELTTRYPGLRRLFLHSSIINEAAHSQDAVAEIWMRDGDNYPRGWYFFLQFAAFCVANTEVTELLEKFRPSKLGFIEERGLSAVESLMGYFDGDSIFSKLLAIRYIGGILELPAFWSDIHYQLQRRVIEKLCGRTIQFIQDIDMDSSDVERVVQDNDGVDFLASAILIGVRDWIQRKLADNLVDKLWFHSLLKLVKQLRCQNAKQFFPRASCRAAENWESFLRQYITRETEIPVISEDKYRYVYEIVFGDHPPPVTDGIVVEPTTRSENTRMPSRFNFFSRQKAKAKATNLDTVEDSDDDSAHHCPSSLLARINAATGTTIPRTSSLGSDEDGDAGKAFTTKIIWHGGGKSVILIRAGDDNWKGRQPMDKESEDTCVTWVHLRSGTHHLRFIVNDQVRISDDLPTAVDDEGSLANYVTVPFSSYSSPYSTSPAVDSSNRPCFIHKSFERIMMERLLFDLQGHPLSWAFRQPVNMDMVDYHEMIKEPMDFSKMEHKLDANGYNDIETFIADAQLVFNNCRIYNPEESICARNATMLEKFMKDQLATYRMKQED